AVSLPGGVVVFTFWIGWLVLSCNGLAVAVFLSFGCVLVLAIWFGLDLLGLTRSFGGFRRLPPLRRTF
ncbi:hypothetical protein, partial [Methylobacterium sp. Leaf399]|uniref:hypothetical protein n=1 Tax=Methylobacterium sp. Leaf399 TaxID=1736364 RepID=UPI001AEBD6D6